MIRGQDSAAAAMSDHKTRDQFCVSGGLTVRTLPCFLGLSTSYRDTPCHLNGSGRGYFRIFSVTFLLRDCPMEKILSLLAFDHGRFNEYFSFSAGLYKYVPSFACPEAPQNPLGAAIVCFSIAAFLHAPMSQRLVLGSRCPFLIAVFLFYCCLRTLL